MQAASLSLSQGAALAPMAGVSDFAMRTVCAEYGAAFTVSEMVSARALTMNDAKSRALLRGRPPGGAPYGVQLFGHEPQVMFDAIRAIAEEDFDFLDLNMGCPAPKICGHGDGSGLLRRPALAGEVAAAAVAAGVRPVTVKLRIGWDDDAMTGCEVARRCEAAGVSLLAVHARTRAQQYTPGVNHAAVAEIKRSVGIPVLFNGDIACAGHAQEALAKTGCDGVMIGRAALGNPFLFAQIAAALQGKPPPVPPTLRSRLALLRRQVDMMCREKGEERAMREARKVAVACLKGLRGAAALRRCAHSFARFADLDTLEHLAWQFNPQRMP